MTLNHATTDHGDGATTEPATGRTPWFCSRWAGIAAGSLIILSGLAVYANSLSVPFIYDDLSAIVNNPTIHHLWPISQVFSPPTHGETVSSRPVLNLSLAINYALSGERPWTYHAVNLLIHLVNGLLLWRIARRTFLLPTCRNRFGDAGVVLAWVIALVWTVHPLQTESVTYIAQRAESLAGLFYLLTLYAVIRGTQSMRATAWYLLAVGACWLGMATKQTLFSVPLVVLIYDRTFLSGSWLESLRKRWGMYAGLVASWGLMATLMAGVGPDMRAGGPVPPDAWSYACTQLGVILHYLRLSLWPHPLCLEYAWPLAKTLGAILPGLLVVGFLLAATIRGVMGGRAWGFLGAAFFLILAPTSSIVPLQQLAFEHRMYLSLAAGIAILVVGAYVLGQKMVRYGWTSLRAASVLGLSLAAAVVVVLGILTFQRNEVYGSTLRIWQDTVAKSPENPGAHNNLGLALADLGRYHEAIDEYQQSLRIQPDHAPRPLQHRRDAVKIGSHVRGN